MKTRAPAVFLLLALSSCGSSGGALTGQITEYPLPTSSSGPSGITRGPDGALWFLESSTGHNNMGRITTDGAIVEFALPTANAFPGSLTAGPDGNLWYVDE